MYLHAYLTIRFFIDECTLFIFYIYANYIQTYNSKQGIRIRIQIWY